MMPPNHFYEWYKLTICVTSCCDQKCLMCPAPYEDQNTLSQSIIIDLIRFAAENGFTELEFTGGEPLILASMPELIDMACASIPLVQLTTNGLRLTDEMISQFSHKKNLFMLLPADGVADTYDEIRQMSDGFKRFEDILRKVLASGISVVLNTVVQQRNFRHLYQIYSHFSSYPILFQGFPLIEPLTGNHKERLGPRDADGMASQFKMIQSQSETENKTSPVSQKLMEWYLKRLHDPETIMHEGKGCNIPYKNLIVTATGFAIPCWQYNWVFQEGLRGLRVRPVEDVVNDRRVQEEIENAVVRGKCKGCATFCYNWDWDVQGDVYGSCIETFREHLIGRSGDAPFIR